MRGFKSGFTLAEILVAMAILGIMMGFAIPKILNTLNSSNSAKAKETMGVLSTALEKARFDKTFTSASTFGDLLQYINYSKLDTTDTASFTAPTDATLGGGMAACSTAGACIVLPNSVYIEYDPTQVLAGTEDTRAWFVNVDVDGHGTAAGAFSYYLSPITGRTTTGANASSVGLTATATTMTAVLPATDPSFVNQ